MKPQFFSGFHAVGAILRHRPEDILEIFALDNRHDQRLDDLLQVAKRHGIACHRANRQALENKAGRQHQGIVARARPRRYADENALKRFVEQHSQPTRLLLLDGVTDPRNLGACLRSADAAGVHGVVVTRHHASVLTPVACRTAAGAAESLTFYEVANLARTQAYLKQAGLFVYGTALDDSAISLYDVQPPADWALVVGAEGSGMRRLVKEGCDQLMVLPMQGEVQSLNVSVATAVSLYWLAHSG